MSTAAGSISARVLPAEIDKPLAQLARRGACSPEDVGLAPDVLRVLSLDGTLSWTPHIMPDASWMRLASDESPISVQALRWAAAFTGLDSDALASRLYFFGRWPVTVSWRRRLPDENAVARWLGLADLEQMLPSLRRLPRTRETWVWRRWAPHDGSTVNKLYVCCTPKDLPDVLHACAPVLRDSVVSGMKVGFDLPTVLRADKLVVYLAEEGATEHVAEAIMSAAGQRDIHPLPFGGETGVGEFVAYARDPDDWPGRPTWQERASWRLYVARLAAETLAAQRGRPWLERVAAALERLSLAGIDTRRWMWQKA
jgi:hypothetical protein